MKCLILAADKIERLSMYDEPPALIQLHGVPLIERTIREAMHAGLDDFCVVTGYKGKRVRAFLDKFANKNNITISHVINEEHAQSRAQAVKLAATKLDDAFVMLSVDYLFDRESLSSLLEKHPNNKDVVVALDRDAEHSKIDLVDVTRVHVADGCVHAMSRGLAEFDAFDTGMYLCPKDFMEVVDKVLKKSKDAELVKVFQAFIKDDRVQAFDIGGAFWSHVDSYDALERTETNLIEQLRKQPSDSPVKRYIFRPVTTRLSRLLMSFNPNLKHISVLSFLLAAIACWFLARETYTGMFFGAVLTFVCACLHISTEEIAKLKHQENAFVTWFDDVISKYVESILLLGLTFHAEYGGPVVGIDPLLVGVAAIVANLMFFYTADKFKQIVKIKPPLQYDIYMKRDVRFFVIALGSILNVPLFTILIITILLNAIVIQRLFGWKKLAEQ